MSDTQDELRAEAHDARTRARLALCHHGPDCICETYTDQDLIECDSCGEACHPDDVTGGNDRDTINGPVAVPVICSACADAIIGANR